MPPFVRRKRQKAPAEESNIPVKRVDTGKSHGKGSSNGERNTRELNANNVQPRETSVPSDASSTRPGEPQSQTKKTRKALAGSSQEDSGESSGESSEDESEAESDDNPWDDFCASREHNAEGTAPEQLQSAAPGGDLELTLDRAPQLSRASLANENQGKKKGPSKVEKLIRNGAHKMHVQTLMLHNHVRNMWICDKELQKILVDGLTAGCANEVERWRSACGNAVDKHEKDKSSSNDAQSKKPDRGSRSKKKEQTPSKRQSNQRDWGKSATHLEEGNPDLSHGDPTIRLLKMLSAYWRKKFEVTAPGLRKQGYKDIERLRQELDSYRSGDLDLDVHGEQIRNLAELKELAKSAKGSRDVGAQLFTALLRGLGLETRMVANLQPVGFGWSKAEEANPPKQKRSDQNLDEPDSKKQVQPKGTNSFPHSKSKPQPSSKSKAQPKRAAKGIGGKTQPIDLSDSDSELTPPPDTEDESEPSDASLIEITPSSAPPPPRKKYDRDLSYPIYWTEVLSPLSHNWIPVDPIVLSVVSNNPDMNHVFEPRGSKADKTKQVLAYVVAHSPDGSAKDVTVRYLKGHVWPGKTKGVRYPAEKVPVYNRHGKVKRYEEYDWFKTLMSLYRRDESKKSLTPRTPADDIEDTRDLQPIHLVRETKGTGTGEVETLQGYKNSAEYVLERHLKREEALIPSAQPVKQFTTGKGEKAKTDPVYRRADVVSCKTVESWHKQGREVKTGEQPLKHVPMRAVTLIRKREIEEAERESGEKMKQGLYSWDQTGWIIPPPIGPDRSIPRNAFGNIDVYVPSMIPAGAAHVPLRATARVCKKLGVDYAEACTGFEFGNKMAVPILTGVVVAEENEDAVIDAWEAEEEARVKREEQKREKLVLGMWKKFYTGLRVMERVRREYGGNEMEVERHVKQAMSEKTTGKGGKNGQKASKGRASKGAAKEDPIDIDSGGNDDSLLDMSADLPGGFLPDGHEEEPSASIAAAGGKGGEAGGGGFTLEEDDPPTDSKAGRNANADRAPISLSSLHQPHNNHSQKEPNIPNGFGVDGIIDMNMDTHDSAGVDINGEADDNDNDHQISAHFTKPAKSRAPRKSNTTTTTKPPKANGATTSATSTRKTNLMPKSAASKPARSRRSSSLSDVEMPDASPDSNGEAEAEVEEEEESKSESESDSDFSDFSSKRRIPSGRKAGGSGVRKRKIKGKGGGNNAASPKVDGDGEGRGPRRRSGRLRG
ncbi:MAG: hypothetical protein M1831_005169 [Alyxoria varia]|nr:MAG: hypothetical protein M1831_005169 [Alyxoria varia]